MTDRLADFTREPMPKNWLVESILVTVLCCLPLGIAGIVFASQVQGKYTAGDMEGARKASDQAGLFTKIGFFLGLGAIVIWLILVFVFGMAGFWGSRG